MATTTRRKILAGGVLAGAATVAGTGQLSAQMAPTKASDINQMFADMIAANPYVWKQYGSNVALGSGPRFVRGGGVLELGAVEIDSDETINLPPLFALILNGTHIVGGQASTMIETVAGNGAVFSRNLSQIIGRGGAGLHGEGQTTTGIMNRLANQNRIEGVLVEDMCGDGVHSLAAQWTKFDHVHCMGNGGNGFTFGINPATPAVNGSHDQTMVNCVADGNVGHGMQFDSGTALNVVGGAVQFNGEHGVHLEPKSGKQIVGATFTGVHWEGNTYHAWVEADGNNAPWNTNFAGGVWLPSDGSGAANGVRSVKVNRAIYNEGIQTSVRAGGWYNDPQAFKAVSTAGGPEVRAFAEQHNSKGSMAIEDMAVARGGGAGNRVSYGCDQNGAVYSHAPNPQNYRFAVSAVGSKANGTNPWPWNFGPDVPNK